MNFYTANLLTLCAINAFLLFRRYRHRRPQITPISAARLETAQRFQRRFLAPYALAVAADWLQASLGPQRRYPDFRLTSGKQLPEDVVARLYATGFVSAAASAMVAGRLVDSLGRRSACLFYCIFSGLACGLMLCSSMPLLVLGRVSGGIATTLLFSAFESWMISEYHLLELDDSVLSLKTVLENMALVNSAVAMISGVAGDALVEASGWRAAPFVAASLCCSIAAPLLLTSWRENTRGGPVVQGRWKDYRLGIVTIVKSKRFSALAIATCCFEGAMYLFVFFWTAALNSARLQAGVEKELPLGLIFSSFMCAMMAGSLISTPVKAPSRQSATTDLCLTMAIGSSSLSCAVLFDDERIVFWAFCVLEATVGAYFPIMGFLKSELVDDDRRGHVYSAVRLPLNLFVLVAHSLDEEGDKHRVRVFLTLAGLLVAASVVVKRGLT
ncbi:hypothetical protein CDD80_4486 [Ophiocordyceps camponoti-rufipedis]|uniref:Molybdate-anion transporter n=1 Tax=Ophiocordyceps camponoti-rufipedis TaxID=2004952 RepID=A0A2C5YXN2_9HYPO|nr:hypothetical protein CDD80_4486 [Ophiocordyceps camponoti-rufipedis]